MDELNADLSGDETRIPRLFAHLQTVATFHYTGLTAELVDIGGRELSAVVVHATQEAAEADYFDEHAELGDFLDLYDFDRAGLTAELRGEWATTPTTRDPAQWLNRERYRNTGLTFERSETRLHFEETYARLNRANDHRAELRAELNKANDHNAELKDKLNETNYVLEEWAANLNKERRLTAILHTELKEAHDELNRANEYGTELFAVIQRQGNRVDREHAGLTAQVTRLTTELDSVNLYNNELRAIVAGRSNQVENELDEALVWGTAYRTKVAALTAELGEAVALLEVVSAEADSYAGRLKALRGAA